MKILFKMKIIFKNKERRLLIEQDFTAGAAYVQ